MTAYVRRAKAALRLQILGIGLLPLLIEPRLGGIPLSWLLAFALLALSALCDHRERLYSNGPLAVFILLIGTSTVIAVLNGFGQGAATANTQEWLSITLVFVALILLIQARISQPLRALRGGLILSGLIISLFRIVDLIASPTLKLGDAQQPVLTEYYLQSAYIVALGTIALFHLAVDRVKVRARTRTFAWVMVFVLVAVTLSFASRTAILMMGLGFLVIILGMIKTHRRPLTSMLLIIPTLAVALSALYLSPAGMLLRQRFIDSNSLASNWNRRAEIQELSLHLASENPLGIGWDSFSKYSALALGEAIRSTHLIYTGLTLSIGLLGMVIFVAILVSSFVLGIIRRDFDSLLASALSSAILTAGTADDITVYPIGFAFILLVASFSFQIVRNRGYALAS